MYEKYTFQIQSCRVGMVWDIGHHPMYFVCLLFRNKWQLKLTVKILRMF